MYLAPLDRPPRSPLSALLDLLAEEQAATSCRPQPHNTTPPTTTTPASGQSEPALLPAPAQLGLDLDLALAAGPHPHLDAAAYLSDLPSDTPMLDRVDSGDVTPADVAAVKAELALQSTATTEDSAEPCSLARHPALEDAIHGNHFARPHELRRPAFGNGPSADLDLVSPPRTLIGDSSDCGCHHHPHPHQQPHPPQQQPAADWPASPLLAPDLSEFGGDLMLDLVPAAPARPHDAHLPVTATPVPMTPTPHNPGSVEEALFSVPEGMSPPVRPMSVTTYDVKDSRKGSSRKAVSMCAQLPLLSRDFGEAPLVCLRELMTVELASPTLSQVLQRPGRYGVRQHSGIGENLHIELGSAGLCEFSLESRVYVVKDGCDLCVYCFEPRDPTTGAASCACRVAVLPQHRIGHLELAPGAAGEQGDERRAAVQMGVYLKIAASCPACKGRGHAKQLKRRYTEDGLEAEPAPPCPTCSGRCRRVDPDTGRYSDGLLIGALPKNRGLKAPLLRLCFELYSHELGLPALVERHEGLVQVAGKGFKSSKKSRAQGPKAAFSVDEEMELQEFIREEMHVLGGWAGNPLETVLTRPSRQGSTSRELLAYFRRRETFFGQKRRRLDTNGTSQMTTTTTVADDGEPQLGGQEA